MFIRFSRPTDLEPIVKFDVRGRTIRLRLWNAKAQERRQVSGPQQTQYNKAKTGLSPIVC